MNTTLILLAAGALLALLAPFWMLFKTRSAPFSDALQRRYRRAAIYSVLVAAVMAGSVSEWSFSVHSLNVLAIAAAFVPAGALVRHAFSLKPRGAGIVVGLLASAGWCLTLLFVLLGGVSRGIAPVTADLGDGVVCRQSLSGFLPSASGRDVELFRRHPFIDHLLYRGSESETDAEALDPPVPPHLAGTLARCIASLDRQRDAKDAVANRADRAYTPAVAPPTGTGDKR